jgi:hypothetical protein
MPAAVQPGDRKILIFAGIALVLMVAVSALLSPQESSGGRGIPSSYSSASGGAKAAFLLLQELGHHIERWEQPPTALPQDPTGTLLILANPFKRASDPQRQALRNFVRNGGTILATGMLAESLLPEGDVNYNSDAALEWQKLRAQIPSPFTKNASEIEMETDCYWGGHAPTHIALYADGENRYAVTYTYGRGRVIWLASSAPLTNAGISRSGNMRFFLNVVGAPEDLTILWDEYFHGVEHSLSTFLGNTPLPWAVVQLGFVAGVLIFTYSRRLGPIRPAAVKSRLSPLEFVDTLGALYHRSHAAAGAVATTYQRFRYLLLRRLSLPANTPISEIHRSVHERLQWNQPGFVETMQASERAVRGADVEDEKALHLIQAMNQYTELWELLPRKKKGKS